MSMEIKQPLCLFYVPLEESENQKLLNGDVKYPSSNAFRGRNKKHTCPSNHRSSAVPCWLDYVT